MTNLKRRQQIEEMILRFLRSNKNKFYSLKDISNELPLRKHEHRELKEIMNNLKRKKEVILKNKQFGIKASPPPKRVVGKFDAGSLVRGYSFAFVNTDKADMFIDSEDIGNAYHGDEVLTEIKYKRRGMLYGKILKVEKRANKYLTGNIDHYQKKYYLIPDLAVIHTTFDISELAGAKKDQKVKLKIEDWGNPDLNIKPYGKVIEVIGEAGDTKVEEISLIKQFELPLYFPDEVLKEAEMIAEKIEESEIKRRHDFRDLLTFTIDPQTAKDYDDAISFEITDNKYILYVHIADVTYYINTDSYLFNEAVSRGNSFYFPRKVIPMLPERISNKICSLRPDEDKLTLTVVTEFDKKFNLLGQSVCESVICSSARLTYEEVDSLFEEQEHNIPDAVSSVLTELRKLSSKMSGDRYAKGYIPFNMPDTVFRYDEEGNIEDITRTRETESHKLIENCMLLANQYTAELLNNKTDKAIYRIHEEPDESAVQKILKLLTYYRFRYKKNLRTQKLIQSLLTSMPNEDYHRVFDPLILRSMKKARYDTVPLGHFGLAMKHYTHFTSPIRRICDLTIHHLIRQALWHQKGKRVLKARKLQEIADNASERELLADRAERETVNRFKKLYMKDKLGEHYSALIVNMNNNNLIVELNSIPVSGVIPLESLSDDYYRFYPRYMEVLGKTGKRVFRLLDKLTVRLERIDFDLIFSLVE